MILLIGLTGPLGSGKGTAIEIISRLASAKGIRVVQVSLSDEIRNEVQRQGMEPGRDTLRQTANTFRERIGNGVWATLIASRIQDQLAFLDSEDVLVLIDAIRNPGEVHEFRSRFGSRFRLLGITAPSQIIRRNLHGRRRSDEPSRVLENENEAEKTVRAEMGLGEPGFGHNVKVCLEMADWPVIHNTGSMQEFAMRIHTWAESSIMPVFQRSHGTVFQSVDPGNEPQNQRMELCLAS